MKKAIIFYYLILSSLLSFSQYQNPKNIFDTVGIWHVINFDTTFNYIHIGSANQNLWQVGIPQKNYFNSAYSQSKAIVTDTLSAYPINNYSYFDLYVGDFNFNWFYPEDTYIDFRHKYNTDTLKDGGYITVSWDRGQTWANIIGDTVSPYFNLNPEHDGHNLYSKNNTLFNGEYGFSGNSKGWIHSMIVWANFGVKKTLHDTLIIRFNFISDNINNPKDGWMIDNIRLFSLDMGCGLNNNFSKTSVLKVFPNPFNNATEIIFDKAYKTIDIGIYDIQSKLIEQIEYSNCNKIHLDRDNLKNGLYFLKITLDKNTIKTEKIILND